MDIGSFNIQSALGCFFLTGIFTTALWATSSVQLYIYYDSCSKTDSWKLKIHVLFVYLLDTALQIVTLHTVYIIFVTNFSDLINILHLNRTDIPLMTFLTAIIVILVQGLYLKRIWHMSKGNKLLTGGIALLILGQFSITMSFFAITYPLKEFPQLLSIINIARAMNTTVGCVEIIIGSVIVYLLHTSRSGFKRTDTAINRLIFYTVTSGLLTGLDAIIGSILSFALPQTEYYLLFCGIGAKLYMNSMLSLLNSRQRVRDALNGEGITDSGSSDIRTSVLRERCNNSKNPVTTALTRGRGPNTVDDIEFGQRSVKVNVREEDYSSSSLKAGELQNFREHGVYEQ